MSGDTDLLSIDIDPVSIDIKSMSDLRTSFDTPGGDTYSTMSTILVVDHAGERSLPGRLETLDPSELVSIRAIATDHARPSSHL